MKLSGGRSLEDLGYQAVAVWWEIERLNSWGAAIQYVDELVAEARAADYLLRYYGPDVTGHAKALIAITEAAIDSALHALEIETAAVRSYAEAVDHDPAALGLYTEARALDRSCLEAGAAATEPLRWIIDGARIDAERQCLRFMRTSREAGYIDFHDDTDALAHFGLGRRRKPRAGITWRRSKAAIVAWYDAIVSSGYVAPSDRYAALLADHFTNLLPGYIRLAADRNRPTRDRSASAKYAETHAEVTLLLTE